MAKYYYDKCSLDRRWSEAPDEPQPYLQKKRINIARDELGTWFGSSGTLEIPYNKTFLDGYSNTQMGIYPKYPSGQYVNNSGIEHYGNPINKIGDIGYFSTRNYPDVGGGDTTGYYSLYKVSLTKNTRPYEGDIQGYWLITRKTNYLDIYEHIYGPKNLVETIEAEDGTYPENGQEGNFWYIKRGLVFPELKAKVNGEKKTSEYGWVKVDGQLKEIDRMWTKIDGAIKEI